jgi:excisionase family DNA binding protein
MTEPLVLTVEETAKILRLSRGATYEACRTGAIPCLRIGRRLLVPRARLYELVGTASSGENGTPREEVDDQAVRAGNGEAGDSRPGLVTTSQLKGTSNAE